MKYFCFVLAIFSTIAFSQKTVYNKVDVGMTITEVRSIMGKPQAIEGGFPQIHDYQFEDGLKAIGKNMTILYQPEQAGQINVSTWFYMSKPYKFKYTTTETYILNEKAVEKDIYDSYINFDTLYAKEYSTTTFVSKKVYDNAQANYESLLVSYRNKYSYMNQDMPDFAEQMAKIWQDFAEQMAKIWQDKYVWIHKDSLTSIVNKPEKRTAILVDVFCISFDKGTQVVAGKQKYSRIITL